MEVLSAFIREHAPTTSCPTQVPADTRPATGLPTDTQAAVTVIGRRKAQNDGPSLLNLTRTCLAGADLTESDLTDTKLAGANLTSADLNYAKLTNANFNYANFTDANFTDANLANAKLSGAQFTHADLTHAYLAGADLTHANCSNGVAFAVGDHVANDALLGQGAYAAGHRATELIPGTDKGTAVVKGFTGERSDIVQVYFLDVSRENAARCRAPRPRRRAGPGPLRSPGRRPPHRAARPARPPQPGSAPRSA